MYLFLQAPLLLFFFRFHQLIPVSSKFSGEIRKLLKGFQPSRNVRLIRLEVTNVLKEALHNCVPHVRLRYCKQFSITAEHYLNNVSILRSSKVVVPSALIMNYQENEGILRPLVNLSYMLLNNSLVLCPYE